MLATFIQSTAPVATCTFLTLAVVDDRYYEPHDDRYYEPHHRGTPLSGRNVYAMNAAILFLLYGGCDGRGLGRPLMM